MLLVIRYTGLNGFLGSVWLQPSEIEEMVMETAKLESLFGEAFDEVIVNTDFQQTYKKVLTTCQSVYSEERWIPSTWLDQ